MTHRPIVYSHVCVCVCVPQRCYPPLTTHEWSGYWWVWWLLIALALLIFLLAFILCIILCCLALTYVST